MIGNSVVLPAEVTPAPNGPFWLAMRIYWPKSEALMEPGSNRRCCAQNEARAHRSLKSIKERKMRADRISIEETATEGKNHGNEERF